MTPNLKRSRSPTTSSTEPPSPNRAKKLKLLASHSLSSPFPDFPRPTPAEATRVHALLASAHPDLAARPPRTAEANDAARTCGGVPDVLESLVGTILSQNTSARNAGAAQRGLDAAFGRRNYAAVAGARREDVVAAIRHGGLANRKAGVIQKILRDVYARHGTYSLQHLAQRGVPAPDPHEDPPEGAEDAEDVADTDADVKGRGKGGKRGGGDRGAAAALRGVSDGEAMRELVAYDGVGPKTASCVLLFCLGRASFPVDTHVFRLARLLGWVPQKADRVTAQAHLDLAIPDALKYGLHVLMVGHGRRCRGCKGSGGGKGACVLKKWLREQKDAREEELEATLVKVEE